MSLQGSKGVIRAIDLAPLKGGSNREQSVGKKAEAKGIATPRESSQTATETVGGRGMIEPTYALGSAEATEVLESLKEGALGAGIVIGFDGYVKFANDAAGRMFGLDEGEIVDHKFAEVFGLFEKFHEIVLDTVRNQGGVSVSIGDTTRSFSVTTSYLTDAHSGAPVGVIAVLK